MNGEEVHAGREQDTAKRITDGRRNDSNDRAEDHRAERIDEKAEVDHQRRGRNRNGDGLQRHADGDEDGRDGEHADLAELTGSVTPVGLGKTARHTGRERALSFQQPCPIPPLRNDGRAAARRPQVNSLVDIKNSSLRNESVRTYPIAQGGKKIRHSPERGECTPPIKWRRFNMRCYPRNARGSCSGGCGNRIAEPKLLRPAATSHPTGT